MSTTLDHSLLPYCLCAIRASVGFHPNPSFSKHIGRQYCSGPITELFHIFSPPPSLSSLFSTDSSVIHLYTVHNLVKTSASYLSPNPGQSSPYVCCDLHLPKLALPSGSTPVGITCTLFQHPVSISRHRPHFSSQVLKS